jgi:hypothetical protein
MCLERLIPDLTAAEESAGMGYVIVYVSEVAPWIAR